MTFGGTGNTGFCRRFAVEAHPERLADVRRFVEGVGIQAALHQDRVFDLTVAVSEACANAMQHSGSLDAPLQICANLEAGRLTVEISDTGMFRPPSLPRCEDTRGLGLPLMVALVDEVHFVRVPRGGTIVTLCVFLDRPACSAVA